MASLIDSSRPDCTFTTYQRLLPGADSFGSDSRPDPPGSGAWEGASWGLISSGRAVGADADSASISGVSFMFSASSVIMGGPSARLGAFPIDADGLPLPL